VLQLNSLRIRLPLLNSRYIGSCIRTPPPLFLSLLLPLLRHSPFSLSHTHSLSLAHSLTHSYTLSLSYTHAHT
jgi:hypothetical protein